MSAGDEVGYGRPPKHTRFKKGRSGNPRGRPPGPTKEPPYEAVLGQMVTVREDGIERRVTAAQAFALYLTKQGLDGNAAAARQAAAAIGDARAKQTEFSPRDKVNVSINFVSPPSFLHRGSVDAALVPLHMGSKLNDGRDTRMALEPWIVEMALGRLGNGRLEEHEKSRVVWSTRDPGMVRWPDWWEERPEVGGIDAPVITKSPRANRRHNGHQGDVPLP